MKLASVLISKLSPMEKLRTALSGSFVRQPQTHWSYSPEDSFSRVTPRLLPPLLIRPSKPAEIGDISVRGLGKCRYSRSVAWGQPSVFNKALGNSDAQNH